MLDIFHEVYEIFACAFSPILETAFRQRLIFWNVAPLLDFFLFLSVQYQTSKLKMFFRTAHAITYEQTVNFYVEKPQVFMNIIKKDGT